MPNKVTDRKRHLRGAARIQEVAGAIARVRAAKTWPGIKLAFQFQVLTAARAAEVRKATWDEIDWKPRECGTCPREHMKAGREAPGAAVGTQATRSCSAGHGSSRRPRNLLFPSARGETMGRNAPATLARRLQLGCVPHGFRSSFRDWAAETESHPRGRGGRPRPRRPGPGRGRLPAYRPVFEQRRYGDGTVGRLRHAEGMKRH